MVLCELDYFSQFGGRKGYANSKSCIIEVLKSCGMPAAKATALYKAGPKEIHLYFANTPGECTSEWVLKMCKPKKTWYNKVGEFFTRGTNCYCCLGYRMLLALAAWPVFFYIGRYTQ